MLRLLFITCSIWCCTNSFAQSSVLESTVPLKLLENCETGSGPCSPVFLFRKNSTDTVHLYFPLGGTSTSVFLYHLSQVDTAIREAHAKMGDQPLVFDLTGWKDGEYMARYLSCGVGGVVQIHLITPPTVCTPLVDTLDGALVYKMVDKMPQCTDKDLLKYIWDRIQLPALKNTDDLQPSITLSFVVDQTGKVRNPCVLKPQFENRYTTLELKLMESLIQMPYWTPGIHEGQSVPVRMFLPLKINYE